MIVDASKIDGVVTCRVVVCVCGGSVTGYELKIVEAGWIDVSMRVYVS